MHKVKVFFFATLRDYVGAKSLEIEIPLEMTIRGLIDLLAVTYPRLSNVKGSILAAINREYTRLRWIGIRYGFSDPERRICGARRRMD
jgi:molybdopterin converting factor small subunit